MTNLKKTLALVLAVLMVVGTFATVSAAPSSWTKGAVEYLDGIGVSTIGNDYDAKLSRNEFVLWVAKIESHQLSDNAWNDEIASVSFTDVTEAHHRAAIAYSELRHFIVGNGDGTFAPDKTVSLAEASAVIVRLMGYESKVTGLADRWAFNYMQVANTYCQAFDQKFLSKTDTYNPDFELTKGEGAYLLATIMNFDGGNRTTADGINLGEYFAVNVRPVASSSAYYVLSLPRVSKGMTTKVKPYINGDFAEMYTNAFDTAATVVLKSAKDGHIVTVPGAEFMKAVRVSLGLKPMNDFMNEEPEINLYNTVQLGTMIDVVIENGVTAVTNYKQLKNLKASANSVVVDTVLQRKAGEKEFVGYGVTVAGDRDNRPTLPTSYTEDKVVTWTNVVKDAAGLVTSATLNFMGKSYAYGSDIKAYTPDWTELTPNDAVNQIINAAQGEAYLVFNDKNGDGRFDTIVVKESYPFAFAAAPNIAGGDDEVRDYMTSISGGKVVGQASNKGNSIGSVIWNKDVTYPNNSWTMASTDCYGLSNKATGKLQLVLTAANAHPSLDEGNYSTYFGVLPFYTVVDLAAFYTGIIEEVDAWVNEGYYTAKVKTTDGNYVTVLIPLEAVSTAVIPVTIGGATAEYTFDSSAWGTFMTESKNAALANGIAKPDNVQNGTDAAGTPTAQYLDYTAAWMAGKFVEFATNKQNVVICMNGTEKAEGTTGFVTAVSKTDTGDNTYNVTIGVEGSATNNLATPKPIYETVLTSGNFIGGWHGGGSWRVARGSHNGSAAKFTVSNGVYGIDADGDGVPDKSPEGYLVDKNGNGLIQRMITAETNHGVTAFKTFEVRASASGMFDFENYNVYNSLFKGNLIDPNHSGDGKVDPEEDLVYVKVMKDAGSLNYVLYNADRQVPAGSISNFGGSGTRTKVTVADGSQQDWWYMLASQVLEGFWRQANGEYIINLKEVPNTRVDGVRPNGVKYYSAEYDATVGFDPYYYRTWNASAKKYEYAVGFATVKVMENVTGEADAIVDTTKTLMVPVFQGATGEASVQLQAKTDAERAAYVTAGYYVDDNGYVFMMIRGTTDIVYKKDASGNIVYSPVVYNWAASTVLDTKTDVLFTDSANLGLADGQSVSLYPTAVIIDKPKTDEGWFPGSYYLVIDGTKYNVTVATKVAVATPSANGFSITTSTIGDLLNAGTNKLFVTNWAAAVGDSQSIENIAFIGTTKFVTDGGDTPVVPTDKNRVVYLDKDAKAVVRQNELSREWMVISNKSAYVLPTGEDIGAIYRTYSTYDKALNAAMNLNLSLEGGKWYIVDKDNRIVDASSNYVKADGSLNILKGTITEVKFDGTTIATMNGKKNVDITKMDTEYFYFDGTGSRLYKAGDSKNVQLISAAAYADLFKDLDKAVEDAQTAYTTAKTKYDNGQLSDARLAYYADNLANAKKALIDAKASSLDQYFNGQFWGFENSPVYRDFVISQGSFQKPATLTFDYIVIGDTLCVFSDSFVLG